MGLPIVYFRSSSFNGFTRCQQEAFMSYILGLPSLSGKAADKGTIVHKALEICALSKKAHQEGKEFIDDEIMGKVEVNNKDPEYLDGILDKAYTYYSEAFVHHNDKKSSKWTKKDLKDCREWMWQALKFNDGMFDPMSRNVVDAEPAFDFELDYDWAKYEYNYRGQKLVGHLALKGTIDLITDVGHDTYEIIDHKTGARKDWASGEVKDYRKLFTDPQLRIYHLACKHLYPHVKNFIVTINFIKDGGPFTMHFHDDDIPHTLRMIEKKFAYLKQVEKPKMLPEINPSCAWQCKSFCHFGKSTFEGDKNILPIIEKRPYKRSKVGEPMTKCEQIKFCIEKYGMDWVMANMTHPNFQLLNYKDPGAVE